MPWHSSTVLVAVAHVVQRPGASGGRVPLTERIPRSTASTTTLLRAKNHSSPDILSFTPMRFTIFCHFVAGVAKRIIILLSIMQNDTLSQWHLCNAIIIFISCFAGVRSCAFPHELIIFTFYSASLFLLVSFSSETSHNWKNIQRGCSGFTSKMLHCTEKFLNHTIVKWPVIWKMEGNEIWSKKKSGTIAFESRKRSVDEWGKIVLLCLQNGS